MINGFLKSVSLSLYFLENIDTHRVTTNVYYVQYFFHLVQFSLRNKGCFIICSDIFKIVAQDYNYKKIKG